MSDPAPSFAESFSVDSLVGGIEEPAAAPAPEPAAEPEAAEEPEASAADTVVDEVEAEAAEGEEPEVAEEEAEDEPEPELGTEDNPYTLKSLPEGHVRVKINGEEEVISLREHVDGHLRRADYTKRLAELKSDSERTAGIATKAKEQISKLERGVQSVLSNPVELDKYMEAHYPDAWDKAVKIGFKRLYSLAQGPEEDRINHARRRDRQVLERERAKVARERAELEGQRRSSEDRAEKLNLVKPALADAFAKAGSPKLTREEASEFMENVGLGMDVWEKRKGRRATQDEASKVILRELRALGYGVAAKKKGAAPKSAPKPVRGSRPKSRTRSSGKIGRDPGGSWSTDDLIGNATGKSGRR